MGCEQSRMIYRLKRKERHALLKYRHRLNGFFEQDQMHYLQKFIAIHNERVVCSYQFALAKAEEARQKRQIVKMNEYQKEAAMLQQQYIYLTNIPVQAMATTTMVYTAEPIQSPPGYIEARPVQAMPFTNMNTNMNVYPNAHPPNNNSQIPRPYEDAQRPNGAVPSINSPSQFEASKPQFQYAAQHQY